jgi:hypothetical protein
MQQDVIKYGMLELCIDIFFFHLFKNRPGGEDWA